jgi:PAS domain S-box-containing protein
MATNLAQIKNRERVITLFVEGINSIFPEFSLSWTNETASEQQNQMEVCTRNERFGFVVYAGEIRPDEMALIHNASQMLGVILENLHQEQLLLEQKQVLEALAEERAQMTEMLEIRVAQRTADLENANQSLYKSRLAALNMMEDAIEARRQAEEIAASLQREIAERKRTEEALRQSEERYRLIADNTSDSIWAMGPDLRFTYLSPSTERLFGYTLREWETLNWNDFVHPAHLDTVIHLFNELQHESTTAIQVFHKDGEPMWVEFTASPIRGANGELTGVVGVTRDITKRKCAEEAEREQRMLAEALSDTARVLNSTLDFDSILDHVLAYVGHVVPHDSANIMLIEGDAAYVARSRGYEKYGAAEWASSLRVLIETFPKLNRALQLGQGYIVLDTRTDDEWTNFPEVDWIRSHIAQVILTEGRVIGLINLDSTVPNTFSSTDAERLQAFADQVAVAIQNAQMYQKLATYSADLEQAVIERTSELTKANDQLRLLSRAKDDFVSNVSHELRTPLTSLTLRYRLLEKHPEQIEKHIEVIKRETVRLTQIIDDLLSLSRLDQRRVIMRPVPVNLNELIEHYVMDRTLLFNDKGLSLDFEPETNLPQMVADRGLLGQVLSIFLTNASNYTPYGGHVVVRTHSAPQGMGFSVSDTGPGISPDDQAKLFTRFFRGKAGRQSGAPGTGLGLAIAKEIVEMHGGNIEVVSAGVPEQGTTFTVWLPVNA